MVIFVSFNSNRHQILSTCSYLLMMLLFADVGAVTNLRIFYWGGSYYYKFVFTGYGILILFSF